MNTKKLAVCTKCWLPINRVSDNVGSYARVDFGECANQPRLGRKEPNMIIIGMDYHPSFQQIAFVDNETGEYQESRLPASRGSGKVLSRSGSPRCEGTGGDGSQWTGAVV